MTVGDPRPPQVLVNVVTGPSPLSDLLLMTPDFLTSGSKGERRFRLGLFINHDESLIGVYPGGGGGDPRDRGRKTESEKVECDVIDLRDGISVPHSYSLSLRSPRFPWFHHGLRGQPDTRLSCLYLSVDVPHLYREETFTR